MSELENEEHVWRSVAVRDSSAAEPRQWWCRRTSGPTVAS
jgi:hypothetical protein